MQRILTIDAHAAGEPCRVVYTGLPALAGSTMDERRRAFRQEFDWVRTGLTHEPRGHSGMFGAVLTPPVRPDSSYGLIFFDPVGYMDGCGHGTLCSIAVRRRLYGPPVVPFSIDNPDGSITRVLAAGGDEDHCTVELAMPPATIVTERLTMHELDGATPGLVHCGNTFLVLDAAAIGVTDLPHGGTARLQAAALRLRAAAQLTPAGAARNGLEVLLYQQLRDAPREFATFVLFNGSQIDRSPCGTGSAALSALLAHRAVIAPGERVRTIGPAGGHFEVEARRAAGTAQDIEVILRGTAHITGVHEWIFSAADNFAEGYLLA